LARRRAPDGGARRAGRTPGLARARRAALAGACAAGTGRVSCGAGARRSRGGGYGRGRSTARVWVYAGTGACLDAVTSLRILGTGPRRRPVTCERWNDDNERRTHADFAD